jgi:hypothetical protein
MEEECMQKGDDKLSSFVTEQIENRKKTLRC